MYVTRCKKIFKGPFLSPSQFSVITLVCGFTIGVRYRTVLTHPVDDQGVVARLHLHCWRNGPKGGSCESEETNLSGVIDGKDLIELCGVKQKIG